MSNTFNADHSMAFDLENNLNQQFQVFQKYYE